MIKLIAQSLTLSFCDIYNDQNTLFKQYGNTTGTNNDLKWKNWITGA